MTPQFYINEIKDETETLELTNLRFHVLLENELIQTVGSHSEAVSLIRDVARERGFVDGYSVEYTYEIIPWRGKYRF